MKRLFIIIAILLSTSFVSEASDLTNKIKNKLTNYMNQSLNENFPYSEFALSSGTNNEVTGSITLINPLMENETENSFFQGSIFLSDDSRKTINLGLARRNLINEDTLLLGANLFYDHELDQNHKRTSLGLEAISSVGALRYNEYWALSGKKTGVDNVKEEALDGRDLKISMPLPYLPTTNLNLRTFEWDGVDGTSDQKGDDISIKAEFSNIDIEVGKRSFNGVTEDEEFIRISYKCCNNDNEEFRVSDKAYELVSVQDKRFVKVERENLIVKQKEMELSIIGF